MQVLYTETQKTFFNARAFLLCSNENDRGALKCEKLIFFGCKMAAILDGLAKVN